MFSKAMFHFKKKQFFLDNLDMVLIIIKYVLVYILLLEPVTDMIRMTTMVTSGTPRKPIRKTIDILSINHT